MKERLLPIVLESAFVEEVVLRTISGRLDERTFRRARDRLYLLPDGDQRESAFWELHVSWFTRLQLGQPIHTALAELPILSKSCTRCLVTRAPTRQDEGADLLVGSEAEGEIERTVVIRLRPSTLDAPDTLLSMLRAELLHVADMVDPAFGYEPVLPDMDGGPTYTRLLQDRYRALWNVTIAGRLVRRGVVADGARAEAFRIFAATFPMVGSATDETFMRFFSGAAHTHDDLVAFASGPRVSKGTDGLVPGDRCPLCRFPTHAPEPAHASLPIELIDRIVADFPTWHPNDGLCRQCADLYRSRPLSSAAAALLPG